MQENTTFENISNDLTRCFHETEYTTIMILNNKKTKILDFYFIFFTLSFWKKINGIKKFRNCTYILQTSNIMKIQ